LFYAFYKTFFSFIIFIVLLVQLYLLLSVFSYWRQLQTEHETRKENEEYRKRQGKPQGFVRENVAALDEVAVDPVDTFDPSKVEKY
jgi:hypothetical protein